MSDIEKGAWKAIGVEVLEEKDIAEAYPGCCLLHVQPIWFVQEGI